MSMQKIAAPIQEVLAVSKSLRQLFSQEGHFKAARQAVTPSLLAIQRLARPSRQSRRLQRKTMSICLDAPPSSLLSRSKLHQAMTLQPFSLQTNS